MRDFTLSQYANLLKALLRQGFTFQTFADYIYKPCNKVVILRHDIDKLPENSLNIARMETSLGIKGSYYYRAVQCSYREEIILQVSELGHEIGYHYETMNTCHGDVDKAFEEFSNNLKLFRNICPVKTICMHGSPLSKYDNREIWEKHDYRNLGIIGEPYFDLDYSKIFYITDTGRKWNNKSSNIRDIVNRIIYIPIKSTNHLILLIEQGKFPDHIMINTHPHRWFEGGFGWYKEFLMQNIKNVVKGILVRIRYDKK